MKGSWMRRVSCLVVAILLLPRHACAQVPRVDHVFVLVEENESFKAVVGASSAPYLNELATNYALATSYFATAHPSIVNYFMLTTGDAIDKKLKALADLRSRPVKRDNVIRALRKNGKTWKVYADGIGTPESALRDIPRTHYVKRHDPLAYFESDFSDGQIVNIVPFTQLATDLSSNTLANYSFIVPNLLHDGHNVRGTPKRKEHKAGCADAQALKQTNDWLESEIKPLVDSKILKEDGLLIIVYDEACLDDERNRPDGGEDDAGGQVAMVLVGKSVKPGFRSTTVYHHEDTLRLTLEVLGIGSADWPGAAGNAKSMAEFFTVVQ
jgi:hypothetical protein